MYQTNILLTFTLPSISCKAISSFFMHSRLLGHILFTNVNIPVGFAHKNNFLPSSIYHHRYLNIAANSKQSTVRNNSFYVNYNRMHI